MTFEFGIVRGVYFVDFLLVPMRGGENTNGQRAINLLCSEIGPFEGQKP